MSLDMELELEKLNLPSDNERPFVIAGPCSAETEEQVMETARQLAMKGCHNFRAGVWKPRTKPGGFEGHGEPALVWMKQVKEETKMLVATEVATPEHVELCMKYGIDILWIGARTSANPFAMQALADAMQGLDIPVFVKNPVNPDLELWIGAMERLNQAGVKRLGAIHRGFSSYDKKIYRNTPMWQIPIELHRRIPDLPIISDPSHIGGRRELIAPLCQQAMDLGFDGLIVESHCDPDKAWSDAKQQVTPDVLDYILSLLVIRDENATTEGITSLRKQIDELDNQLMELLSKRMRVCREIGEYKKQNNMTVLQASRYNEILDKRGAQGSLLGMGPEFVAKVFESIHEESVRQQIADRPVAEERVHLPDQVAAHQLVAAKVKRPEDDARSVPQASHRASGFRVRLRLLLFGGIVVLAEPKVLAPVEADSLRAERRQAAQRHAGLDVRA
jgi:chorismate mutase